MDEQFPYTAEDSHHDDGKSELTLRQKEDKPPKENEATTSPLREVKVTHKILPIGQQFLQEGQGYDQKEYLNSGQVEETPNIRLGGSSQLQLEKELETDRGLNGFQSSTTATLRQYPQEGSIAVFLRGMSTQPRSRLIQVGGNHTVWAYEEVTWDSLLKPSVQCFTKNMEAKIPHELVKIGREE